MVIRKRILCQLAAMVDTEIIPSVHVTRGKFAGEFGYIASYLLVDEGEVLVIDPGTAGDPGERIEKALNSLGLNHKNDIVGIFCTHGHPDHVGGADRLKKATGAPVMIHEKDAELLRNPQSFFEERLLMDRATRLSMKLDKGPLRINYRGLKPDRLLSNGEMIQVGKTSLKVILTGGHSAGHCVLYDSSRRLLFSGDEVNNFPNDPRKFYTDLSGSLISKLVSLEKLAKMDIEHLLPSHDIPHLFGDAHLQFGAVRDSVIHFQDIVLSYLGARGDADIGQLAFDVKQSRSIPIPESLDSLIATTIQVALDGLAEAGLVKRVGKGIWTKV